MYFKVQDQLSGNIMLFKFNNDKSVTYAYYLPGDEANFKGDFRYDYLTSAPDNVVEFFPPQCVLPLPDTTDITYIDLGVKIITGTTNLFAGENVVDATCPAAEGSLPLSQAEYV